MSCQQPDSPEGDDLFDFSDTCIVNEGFSSLRFPPTQLNERNGMMKASTTLKYQDIDLYTFSGLAPSVLLPNPG